MRTNRLPIALSLVLGAALAVAVGVVLAADPPAVPAGGNSAAPPALGADRLSRTEGERIAAELLAGWKAKTGRDWVLDEKATHTLVAPYDNSGLVSAGGQGADHVYGRVTKEDVALWAREAEAFAAMGSRVFHDARALGSTNAVSCDMCHPHGANTHAETYPKFQRQAGRAFLLRDMVNWCLVNPCRAKAWDADDPRMRAIEAYLYAQRRGTALEYGKH